MSEPRKVSRAEWQAALQQEWQASGDGFSFGDWQARRFETAEQVDTEAELRAERHDRLVARLERETPARYADATTTEPKLLQWATALVKADQEQALAGPSVLVVGPTGTGKTHGMYGALRAYVLGGGRRFPITVTAADLYAKLRPHPGMNAEEVFTSYADAPLLAVDDLGAAKGSEWTNEIDYRLLNYRYNEKLPTIITSNVPPRDLGNIIGDRVASRIREMCAQVVLKGDDRRRKAG